MSKLYTCDICGTTAFVAPDGFKTIVILDHQDDDSFLAKYNYKRDILIPDVCPKCLDKVIEKINELKEEVSK